MADSLLAREVSDLCLGKPALRSLTDSATVAQALVALRRFGDSFISVWSCDEKSLECRCVGKVCMVDVICFLAREENLKNPASAIQKPLSLLLVGVSPGIVRHLEPYASSTLHNGREYCWLTQEDVIRYLLNCIGFFSPLPSQTVESLNIIDKESILAVRYDEPAQSALPLISQSLAKQTSVAILDEEGGLVGEISPTALNYCDESVAAAVATLSAGDLMAYVDCCGDPPEELVQLVKQRLKEKNLVAAVELVEGDDDSSVLSSGLSSASSCSSEDEEVGGGWHSPKVVRNTEDIVCYPWSSLVAVMIQTLSHRTGYIWVVEEDGCLAGVVTFAAMTRVFRERLKSMAW
ncbi:CBS domain-containing protein CBSX5 [Linum perenne]